MAKIIYRQMPASPELSQQIFAPPPPLQAKAGMQKPQGRCNFLVQIPGGGVMDEIDTSIIYIHLYISYKAFICLTV